MEEKLLPVMMAVQQVVGEVRHSAQTLWRWGTHGILAADGKTRVKLKVTKLGQKLYCTVADVQEFIRATNDDGTATPQQ